MPAPQVIHELVKKFERNLAQYKSASYNETETRVEFLNPFWEALGWDVNNRQGYALNYREVIHEDSIRLKGVGNSNSKAPDYAFRIGENRKFFLEAKKPSVAIKTDVSPAYQLRCYGWSCGLPISVLSDFEEMAVYDCRIRPKISDPASVARIKYFTFREYIDRWDEIEEIFHRENILRGSFDRFVQSRKSKAGTSEVDDEFLREIEEWRVILARDAAKNNPELDARALNFVVQRTIDRIVFLRMAEDRGIEPEEQLFRLYDGKKTNIYAHLLDIYRAADEKYNSGFFHFTNEPGETEPPDELTPKLNFSDRALTEILSRIYPPISPYRFDVLPVEILGNVYERFLGKVIRITPSRQVKVEEKPEVKKANGVFYTPPYIVNYIVQNTVGRLCEGKTPKEVAKLKILDPACGSGSFLLGAYKFLMDWHLKYWLDEMARTGKIPQIPPAAGRQQKKSDPNTLCQSATGEWRLTLTERKRILLNNIYGVDLDAQAVEVTKLSLSLCVLEGFNDEALQSNLRLFYDRALPNLSENIRCGNSLIGPDFFAQSQGTLFDLEEQLTINAFDWRDPVHGFGTILKNGGFDAVIGNPPYVSAVNHQASAPEQREHLTHSKEYRTLYQKWDLYLPFLEKGLRILAENGFMAMIIPYPFINQIYAKLMREEILREHTLLSIVDGSGVRVFRNAVVTNCIPLIAKRKTSDPIQISRIEGETIVPAFTKTPAELVQDEKTAVWNLTEKKNIAHDYSQWHTLGDYCFISVGMVLNADERKAPGKFKKDDLISETEDEIHCKKYMEGKDVDRYKINRIRFLEWGTRRVPDLIRRPTFPELYSRKKLMINKLGTIKATLDDGQLINHNHTIHAAVLWCDLKNVENASINNSVKRYSNYKRAELERFSKNIDLHYLLGILNSKYANVLLADIRGDDFNIYPEHLKKIPIPPIDFTNPAEKAQHDRIVAAVTELLALNRRLQTETFFNPQERVVLERRAASLDRQIDDLVFDLYGLTPEERALCE